METVGVLLVAALAAAPEVGEWAYEGTDVVGLRLNRDSTFVYYEQDYEAGAPTGRTKRVSEGRWKFERQKEQAQVTLTPSKEASPSPSSFSLSGPFLSAPAGGGVILLAKRATQRDARLVGSWRTSEGKVMRLESDGAAELPLGSDGGVVRAQWASVDGDLRWIMKDAILHMTYTLAADGKRVTLVMYTGEPSPAVPLVLERSPGLKH